MLAMAGLLTTVHVMRSRNLPDRAIGIDMLVALVLNGLAVAVAVTRDGLVGRPVTAHRPARVPRQRDHRPVHRAEGTVSTRSSTSSPPC